MGDNLVGFDHHRIPLARNELENRLEQIRAQVNRSVHVTASAAPQQPEAVPVADYNQVDVDKEIAAIIGSVDKSAIRDPAYLKALELLEKKTGTSSFNPDLFTSNEMTLQRPLEIPIDDTTVPPGLSEEQRASHIAIIREANLAREKDYQEQLRVFNKKRQDLKDKFAEVAPGWEAAARESGTPINEKDWGEIMTAFDKAQFMGQNTSDAFQKALSLTASQLKQIDNNRQVGVTALNDAWQRIHATRTLTDRLAAQVNSLAKENLALKSKVPFGTTESDRVSKKQAVAPRYVQATASTASYMPEPQLQMNGLDVLSYTPRTVMGKAALNASIMHNSDDVPPEYHLFMGQWGDFLHENYAHPNIESAKYRDFPVLMRLFGKKQ